MKFLIAFLLLVSSAQAQMTTTGLLHLDRSFAQATSQKRLAGWMEYMMDPTVIFGPQHSAQRIVGKEEIQKYYSGLFALSGFSMQWTPDSAELLPTKNTGYTRGTFHWVIPNPKCDCRNDWHGSYLAIWEEEQCPGGDWNLKALIPSLDESSTSCGCGS